MSKETAALVIMYLKESSGPLHFVAGTLLAEEDPKLKALGRTVEAEMQRLNGVRYALEEKLSVAT